MTAYREFLERKVPFSAPAGFEVDPREINPRCSPHVRAIVPWLLRGGRRALFASFGLQKTVTQLETVRLAAAHADGAGLIVLPLGVRQEFIRDANERLGWKIPPRFVRSIDEVDSSGVYLTNYETVRDGKLDPRHFVATSLDEAACLRGFGGTKTFREFMRLFAGDGKTLNERIRSEGVRYRFVATATPSPNDYIELLAYSAYLDIMDVSAAKTRFFKRNSEKADELTLHPHKEREFWLWVASWALFVTKPSDLGPQFSDEGYQLPPLDLRWHEIPSNHANAGAERDGQARLFRNAAIGVVDAAREKRDSLEDRIGKLLELRAEDREAHRVVWHDLEAEREALEQAIPTIRTVYGNQEIDDREDLVAWFSDGRLQELGAKPVMLGSGCNLQRHCRWAIYLGIGFRFADFIQSIHRLQRFGQPHQVRIDLIYTEAERDVKAVLERKWQQHNEMVAKMTELIREYGLSEGAMAQALTRALGVERIEVKGNSYQLVNADCVEETRRLEDNSVDLLLTSIPFSTQYEYSPNYSDFGHCDNNAQFFEQMDYLTPHLLRVLKPGRIAAIHVKDRIVPGGMTGLGFQTVYPFHARCIEHYTRHGFAYMGMKTIVTDVVRENNQTYRLGWTEQCKDGTKMGCGMPEYLLLFRRPPSETVNSYADEPVVKSKEKYSRSRWQIDAHGFTRSSGNRLLTPQELEGLPAQDIFRMFREYSLNQVYDFEHHVRIGEALEARGRLPVTFMLLQPQSWHPDVWTDITRMLTLNGAQSAKGREMHLCLARGSQVLTKELGYIPIQDVIPGQHVLTHKGRWRKVLIVRNTGMQPVITLKAQGVSGLTLTPDHKLWVRKSDWVREREGAECAEPGWLQAQEALGGYVNFKLPASEDTAGDETLWWTVGRWLADGHIDTRGCAIISCGKEKWEAFSAKIGRFGGNTPSEGTAFQLQLHDPGRTLRAILERCGNGAAAKHLPPEAFTLSRDKAAALLDGYLSGDGHFLAERDRWQATSVSRELLLGISFLAQRVHGAIATLVAGRGERQHVIQGREVHARQEWVLSFNLPSERRKQPFILDDGSWRKVSSLEDSGVVETWCLKVEEDESFTAEGCIVKNCPMQFDLVDRAIEQYSMPDELVFDPFAGLGTVPYRAVLKGRRGLGIELSQRYFLDACGYCQAAEQEVSMPDLFAVGEAQAR